ncbi:hypothetical protein HU200_056527 [Digitaria exilis]|uniref:TF-B3 domain-containing protein n=1 Tax=Digitaria exilis TaxID=1010633 RepID=A0A835E2J4_9POAL|nr:hypothetical protein HU200_056527 [Digitaria exilis]CAB3466704.1 unnamed protein product [Digitaria exilis]
MALTLALEMSASRPSDDDIVAVGGGEGVVSGSGAGDSHGISSSSGGRAQRERMFEKVVTPSDVGKLNRLVVPKHLAEKHLPLPAAAARAGGTVLCFHDAGGQAQPSSWRFRYSYWSSSQSYVMTKGWSRYVRDKRLAAGDTVSFFRDGARLFIDCRRWNRRAPPPLPSPVPHQQHQQQAFFFFPQAEAALQAQPQPQPQQQDLLLVAMEEDEKEARLRSPSCLRLFGVNMELDHHQLRAEPLLLDLQL